MILQYADFYFPYLCMCIYHDDRRMARIISALLVCAAAPSVIAAASTRPSLRGPQVRSITVTPLVNFKVLAGGGSFEIGFAYPVDLDISILNNISSGRNVDNPWRITLFAMKSTHDPRTTWLHSSLRTSRIFLATAPKQGT